MSIIQLENGKTSAFGLLPGTSTVEEIEEKFGAVQKIESIEGAQLYTFADGGIQAAREDNHLCISTLWINADTPTTKDLPQTLSQLKDIFHDLKAAERPENGILLAECNGLKVACDLTNEFQKVLWVELTQPE
jgi:hypothetical protein